MLLGLKGKRTLFAISRNDNDNGDEEACNDVEERQASKTISSQPQHHIIPPQPRN